MKSIRLYLVSIIVSTVSVIIFIAIVVGYKKSIEQTKHLLNNNLESKHSLVSDFVQLSEQKNILVKDLNDKITKHNFLIKVYGRDEVVVLGAGEGQVRLMEPAESEWVIFNYNGRRWYGMIKPVESTKYKVLIAEPEDVRHSVADNMIVDIIRPILVGLFFIAILTWWLVRIGFSPVKSLAESIHQKSISDLSFLKIEDIPEELLEISRSVNDLFSRITKSFEREKQFTADAAHEMRNPITALKLHVDNLIGEQGDGNEQLLKIKAAIDRLGHLVDQLLILHRMSPEQYTAGFADVDLYAVASEVVQDLYPEIAARGQTVELEGEHAVINGDLFGLQMMIKNIVDNAIKYTPEGGSILLGVSSENKATFFIEDSGEGIDENELPRVMDRFYRVGGDHHYSKVIGSGLGLSIVKHIVDLHNATIHFSSSRWGGLRIEIIFGEPANAA